MATIKSYSDLQQSKKLAEILPLESADMRYKEYTSSLDYSSKHCVIPSIGCPHSKDVPCWSLAALLGVLPSGYVIVKNYHSFYYVESRDHSKSTNIFDNPVDACVTMIEKLNELKLL